MNAKDARNLVSSNKVYQKIQQACFNGKYVVSVDADDARNCLEQLREDGYTVSDFTQYSDTVTISWKLNKSQYDTLRS